MRSGVKGHRAPQPHGRGRLSIRYSGSGGKGRGGDVCFDGLNYSFKNRHLPVSCILFCHSVGLSPLSRSAVSTTPAFVKGNGPLRCYDFSATVLPDDTPGRAARSQTMREILKRSREAR